MSSPSLSSYRTRGVAKAANVSAAYWDDAARSLARAANMPQHELEFQVRKFHQERVDSVPDLTLYPELRGYRERLAQEHAGLIEGGLSETTIALAGSLHFWRGTRLFQQTGRAIYAQPMPEKCRVLYVPESDQGALHLKNVDDPLLYWNPKPPVPAGSPWPHSHPLIFDGVGNGLHLDEVPPEIFPVNVVELCREHCTTVPEATEFLTRYNYFWRHQNLLVHDQHGNSVAFDKTACRVVSRGPGRNGVNFVNGMGASDPGMAAFIRGQRDQYLRQEEQSWDGPDGCYFTFCENKWRNMTAFVEELSTSPSLSSAKALMERRDPDGPMCLTGGKSHPGQQVAGYTLTMDIYFMDQKQLHRRQWRGSTPVYQDTPEIVQFN